MSVYTGLKSFVKRSLRPTPQSAAAHAEPTEQPFVPAGHFYSPLPAIDEIRAEEAKVFNNSSRTVAGINLREEEQLQLLKSLVSYYDTIPFQAQKQAGLRYYYENSAYSYSDAIFLHSMMRHLKPRRLIEIGSGFSSCVTLDTNELFLKSSMNLTFIEPYPELLKSLIREQDRAQIEIIPKRLQDVDINVFRALQANDVLFIDSTHVGKIHSDVNRIFFEILPLLARGVYIHIHDVFYPFEYPKEWIYQGRAWNEQYMLRTFLQYNNQFSVQLMNTFMEQFHEAFFAQHLPLCLKNRGGSIWLRRE